MSRIGLQPIAVPDAVDVEVDGPRLTVRGALGELEHEVPPELELEYRPESRQIEVTRNSDARRARSLHGLHRSVIASKVEGVASGFARRLEIYGTGYSAEVQGRDLVLQVGFCHEVRMQMPDGVSAEVEQRAAQADSPARVVIRGTDKQQVGQFAARVHAVRPPEPYKGKGIRYEGEYVRRKEGKAFTGLGG